VTGVQTCALPIYGNIMSVATNPVDPDQRRRVNKAEIQTQRASDLSPMPAGLVNTLTKADVLDLLSFLETETTSIGSPRTSDPPH